MMKACGVLCPENRRDLQQVKQRRCAAKEAELVGRTRVEMQEESRTTASHTKKKKTPCPEALKMERVMNTATQTGNVTPAQGLKHRQFQSLLQEMESEFTDVPRGTEARLGGGSSARTPVGSRTVKQRDPAGSQDERWKWELAAVADRTARLGVSDPRLQGRDLMTTDMHDEVERLLWETQTHQ